MVKLPDRKVAKMRDQERAAKSGGRRISLKCDICGKMFETVTQKVRHRREAHADD